MRITIIGTGFVGVVTAAVYASFGNDVFGLDIDPQKVASLKKGQVPFYEPGLEELLIEQQKTGHLTFTTDYAEAIKNAEVIMVAVGTPSAADGQADLKFVFAVAESIAPHLQEGAIVVIKSTVPPGTLAKVAAKIDPLTNKTYHLASVPEFLREGTAVHDTLHPNRIVLGADDPDVIAKLSELHAPLKAPIVAVSAESAQMAKYAANAYLALRITFANQIADLCQHNGADIQEVVTAIGYDQRIGSHYWYPGLGYGGSCFPKDVKELAAYSQHVGETGNLFIKMTELNEERIPKLLKLYETKIDGWQDKKVAVLGLSFKPNTDDMREAPSLCLISSLTKAGATVAGYDPKATWPDTTAGFTQVDTITEACANADVIMVVIEWPEIITFDFSQVRAAKPQWLIDCRNQLDRGQVSNWGYEYIGIGRGQL